jgi:signal transduction histidine kinase
MTLMAGHVSEAVNPDDPPVAESLQDYLFRRFVSVAFFYRFMVAPTEIVAVLGGYGAPVGHAPLCVAVIIVVSLVNLALAVIVWRGRLFRLGRSSLFMTIDVAVALLLNFGIAFLIPPNRVYWGGWGDIFTLYLAGTVALWSGWRGLRAGILIALMGIPLQLAMAKANHATPSITDWSSFFSRELWLVLSWGVSALVVVAFRRAVKVVWRVAAEAGWARMAREVCHDLLLPGLDNVARHAERAESATALDQAVASLKQIGEHARRQAAEARPLLEQPHGPPGGLFEALARLASETNGRGPVEAEFRPIGPEPSLGIPAKEAIRGAVAEALRNVENHAHARTVRIETETNGTRFVARVVDDGKGFDANELVLKPGFGIEHSIRRRLIEVGGEASLVTSVGEGTTWELTLNTGTGPAGRNRWFHSGSSRRMGPD